ncbi:MAG TPA: hypothetical protein VFH56_02170 [Acidimicrobiales bacterium]|nr:hypothetical protein [Acidimicrobiales bacterium]
MQLARLAGLNLDPWQELTLRSMLRTAPDSNRWAAYESLILVPRQNGKSVTLEAFDLAKLFLSPPGHMVMHTAHLFPTAMESFRHLLGLIKNTPELWDDVARVSNAHGSEGIELKNGSRLRFAARGVNGAGRGFSPDDVVFDEAYRLPAEAEEALLYAISAKPNPQLVYASSTGFPDSDILWALVQRGRAGGDESLMMAEWSADPSWNLLDEDQMWRAVAEANPALGFRLDTRKTIAEYRKAVSQNRLEGFGRERLGLWAEAALQSVFPAGSWENCGDSSSQIPGTPMFGLSVSVDRTTATIGACGAREDQILHLEAVANRRGTDWIVPDLAEITARNGGSVVIDPSSPAGSLIDDMQAAGVKVWTVTARDYAQACGWLFDAVQNKEVRHLGQPELDEAVTGAQLRTLAGGFAWDLRKPLSDITPLVAVTLACWGYRTYGGSIVDSVW